MAEFTVNPQRFDPYKNFKFRVKWDGRYVAGVSKVGALKRTTEVVKHREGGDPSSSRKSPGRTEFEAITLARSIRDFRCKIGIIPIPKAIVSRVMDSLPGESVELMLAATKAECERKVSYPRAGASRE